MAISQLSQTCSTRIHCTECPERKNCILRKFFYDELFNSIFSKLINSSMVELMLSGHSYDEALLHYTALEKNITLKREIELTLHPTYSIE